MPGLTVPTALSRGGWAGPPHLRQTPDPELGSVRSWSLLVHPHPQGKALPQTILETHSSRNSVCSLTFMQSASPPLSYSLSSSRSQVSQPLLQEVLPGLLKLVSGAPLGLPQLPQLPSQSSPAQPTLGVTVWGWGLSTPLGREPQETGCCGCCSVPSTGSDTEKVQRRVSE